MLSRTPQGLRAVALDIDKLLFHAKMDIELSDRLYGDMDSFDLKKDAMDVLAKLLMTGMVTEHHVRFMKTDEAFQAELEGMVINGCGGESLKTALG